ncbi:MAG: hypothetical protein ACYCS9_08395 [Candidatus Dormibacteria bacterium]
MVSAGTVLMLAVVIGALYVLLARVDGSKTAPTPGGVAYSVTIGVIGILAGGAMVLTGLWLLLMGLAAPGLFLFQASGPAQVVIAGFALVVILSGALIFRVARQRLRQM